MDKISFMGQEECLKLSNGVIELIASTAIGPRILCFRFPGEDNIFAELPEAAVQTEIGTWKPYGGHRLWAAPEEMPLTYYPDNDPIHYESIGEHSVILRAPIEALTNLQKEMRITMSDRATVTIDHLIKNCGREQVEHAAWGLTIMRGGGTTIIPQEPFRSHDDYLLPARPMVMWYFTDLTDSRWKIGKRLIQLSTNDALPDPQKIGVLNKQGWAAYYRGTTLFVKEMEYLPEEIYPDYGCNTETYTAGSFMELESLGIMQEIEPGETITHQELWHLFRDVHLPEDEAERADAIEALLRG